MASAQADQGVVDQAQAPAPEMAEPGAGQGTVRGDRCNVRARPSLTAEVVAQLSKGAAVEVLERQAGAGADKDRGWLRIRLPDQALCFVSTKFVKEGAVTGDSVYVRSGPGTNYRDVGKLAKGDTVIVVKSTGDWVQIKPTAACSGWIAAELVEMEPEPAPEEPAPAEKGEAAPPPEPTPVAAAPVAPEVQIVDIDPDELILPVLKVGVLRSVGDKADAPADYELMTPEVERRQHRICYVNSGGLRLARYDGRNVRVFGQERWRKGDRYPVVVAERVDLVW